MSSPFDSYLVITKSNFSVFCLFIFAVVFSVSGNVAILRNSQ